MSRTALASTGLWAAIAKHFADGNEHHTFEVVAKCGHLIPPEIAIRAARRHHVRRTAIDEVIEIGRSIIVRRALFNLGATPLGATSRKKWETFRLSPGEYGVVRGERHGNSTFTDDKIRAIRRRVSEGETQRSLAAEFGVNPGTISKIVRRERWEHVA